MRAAIALVVALGCAGCVTSDDPPERTQAPGSCGSPAWGDPMESCDRFACAEVTDCEAYDEGIVCACRYEDGLARSCEFTGDPATLR